MKLGPEPVCEEHTDQQCWKCRGRGVLACAEHAIPSEIEALLRAHAVELNAAFGLPLHAEPWFAYPQNDTCQACEANVCSICAGKGHGFCPRPGCEVCGVVVEYWRAVDDAIDRERDDEIDRGREVDPWD
jgi:hypothetical protein